MADDCEFDITKGMNVLEIGREAKGVGSIFVNPESVVALDGQFDRIFCTALHSDIVEWIPSVVARLKEGGKILVSYPPSEGLPVEAYIRKLLANTGLEILSSDAGISVLARKPDRAFTEEEMLETLLKDVEGFEDEGREAYLDEVIDMIRSDLDSK